MTSDTPQCVLSREHFDAVVLDLDGVVTRTAAVHAAAWKAMFDDFLSAHPDQSSFDIRQDYFTYLDGKPRLDGIRSFLASRQIRLPEGDPRDGPDQNTVHGLGSRKNRRFRAVLEDQGVEVYPESVTAIRAMRAAGLATAVVSSSRNCRAVLRAAGIEDLFDVRVDGEELARLNLAGKPAPDMFLEAVRRLGARPLRAAGIEDAGVGVTAAKAAGFGCVVGVDRGVGRERLLQMGADVVVADLDELQVVPDQAPMRQLPSALTRLDDILPRDQPLALFLDYDGTLTPIVERPDAAVLSDAMRRTLGRLAESCNVAILSGRDLPDVRERVGLPEIWYAGSHGFDIAGPGGQRFEHPEGADFLDVLDAVERALKNRLGDVAGCQVERKRYAIATHYRRVAEQDVNRVKEAVAAVHADHTGLRLTRGKKLLELQPDIDWHKGKALAWLMDALDLRPEDVRPVYLGDDVTDEDAFAELAGDGIGIVVAGSDRPTQATYRLDDVDAVAEFLRRVAERLETP